MSSTRLVPVAALASLCALLAACSGDEPSLEQPPTAATVFPAPPRGAVVFARQDRSNALALALRQNGRVLAAQVSVVGNQGNGVRRLPVRVVVDGRRGRSSGAGATPCGPGCYRARVAVQDPRAVTVRVGLDAPTVWRVQLPERWPPPGAASAVARVARTWRNLRSLEFTEELRGDEKSRIVTRWRMVAPDRLAYEIDTGGAGVIIGGRRWDRQNGTWTQSEQTAPIDVPAPLWTRVENARALGPTSVNGRRAERVTFYDPSARAWFDLAYDPRTSRPLGLRMVTTAHFMRHVYGPFDRPLTIEPPR